MINCPRGCQSSPVGAIRLRPFQGQTPATFPRGESVKSAYGGYGLYYRTPLAEVGVVARSGTLLGDKALPIDVLYETDRATRLAAAFADSVADTEYVKRWMMTNDSIPAEVIAEYAEAACLCRLRDSRRERQAVHEALFGSDPEPAMTSLAAEAIRGSDDEPEVVDDENVGRPPAVTQRRRSVAHYLSLIASDPSVVDDEAAYREALWGSTGTGSSDHDRVAGQWAALVAKDLWQEALCSIWSEFCRTGLARSGPRGGLRWDEVRDMTKSMVAGPPVIPADMPAAAVADAVAAGEVRLAGLEQPLREAPVKALRRWTVHCDRASSGLIVILELHRRTLGREDPGWAAGARVRSAWQPSLVEVFNRLDAHLDRGESAAEILWWLTHSFVFRVHERIAYSKLPEHTFRFRWEDAQVRFFSNGIGRFSLAAIRHNPLTSLTHDLNLWADDGEGAALTGAGSAFVREVFP